MSDEIFNQTGEEEEGLNSFVEEATSDLPAGATFITVSSTSSGRAYVPTSEPMTAAEVLNAAGLYTNGAVEFWLNNARVTPETIIPVGETLVLIGSVKGG